MPAHTHACRPARLQGDDSAGTGTSDHPFKTAGRALNATRALPAGSPAGTIVLAQGVHFLVQTLQLGAGAGALRGAHTRT